MKTTTEIEILDEIAESTTLTRKQVAAVLDELGASIRKRLRKDHIFTFIVPGLMAVRTVIKKAIPARQVLNPFNKEPVIIPPRPAVICIKISPNRVKRKPRKTLKDMVTMKPESK